MNSGSSGRKPKRIHWHDARRLGMPRQERPRPEESEDTLEQIQREIDAYKEERLAEGEVSLRDATAVDSGAQVPVTQPDSPSASRVFICNPSEDIYADLVCICDCEEMEVVPRSDCPIHGEAD